jgi:DNA-binding NarL/FixJ family response regulator
MRSERSAAQTTLVLADRFPLIVEGIGLKLRHEFDIVATANDGHVLLALIRNLAPDLVVADIDLPIRNALDVLREVRGEGIATRFVLLSGNSSPHLAHLALEAGGSGFVLKHEKIADVVRAIEHVRAGRTYVTPRVREAMYGVGVKALTPKRRAIVRLLARGMPVKQIAAELGISVRTVEHQKYNIMQALHVHSVLELVMKAEALGLLY